MVIRRSCATANVPRILAFVTLLVCSAGAGAAERSSSLQEQVDRARPGVPIVLPPGHYAGTLHLRHPVLVRGAGLGETTLENAGGVAVVVEAPGVELQNMTVTGATAIDVHSGAALTGSGLDLWGTGDVLRVAANARVKLTGGTVSCQAASGHVRGAAVNGSLEATEFRWTGPCYRAVHVDHGSLALRRSVIDGSTETAVHLLDSSAELTDVRATLTNTEGAVIFAARSRLTVRNSTLRGGLEGILLHGGQAELSGLSIERATSVGLAVNGLPVHVDHLRVEGPFSQAAILVAEGASLVGKDLALQAAGTAGVLILRGEAELSSLHIAGTRFDKDGDFGHGVIIEEARARLDTLSVDDAQGAAVYASNRKTSVALAKGSFSHVGVGISVVQGAHLRATATTVSNAGVGFAITEKGQLSVEDSTFQAELGELDCEGTRVDLTRVTITAPNARRPCKDEEFDPLLRGVLKERE